VSPRRTFGATWWGGAWIDALEQRAHLDPNRLPRGRTYARGDRAGALTIGPGFVEAPVQGSRPRPYQVTIRVRTLSVAEWDRVLDAIAGRAAHAAALLDGELPAAVLADAQEAGVELLPVAGEVQPRCSCPDWAEPCKHAAAVCYLVADVLDRDPFELLHLRGRTRAEVLTAVRDRRQGRAPAEPGDPTGTGDRRRPSSRTSASAGAMTARDAFGRPQPDAASLLALASGPPPAGPGNPAPLALDPPPGRGLDREGLHDLAADAARRAWGMLRGEEDGSLDLGADVDFYRRAAAAQGTPSFTAMAGRARLAPAELARLAAAWEHGGEEGLRVAGEPWSPVRDPERAALIHDARRALAAATGLGGKLSAQQNRVTRGAVQLRLAPSGRWYRFGKVAGAWQIVAGPTEDPAALLVRWP
jgi:uncharacterized Zn finger protein